jgi:type VI secretion system protein ImpA
MEIDLERIAQPISPEQPAGPDMRADDSRNNSYYRLRDVWDVARRKEREALNSDPEGDQKQKADSESYTAWRSVTSQSLQLLTREAKDLEVAAFLIQSALRTEGTEGLAGALSVARTIVEHFWDVLYPQLGEEGISLRLRPIESLSTAPSLLIEPLRRVEVTGPGGHGPYTFSQYLSAASGRGSPTMSELERSAADTEVSFYSAMYADLVLAQREFDELSRLLNEKAGLDESGRPQGPSLGDLKQALVDSLNAVQHLAKGRLESATETTDTAAADAATPVNGAPNAGTSVPGRLESRGDALRMLEKVAEFFERQDPHSLLGAQVRKIVRLANMKPADYYSELLEDESARKALFKLVGIDPPPE